MALEKQERRTCDICGDVIKGDYYEAEKKYHVHNDGFVKVNENVTNWYTVGGFVPMGDSISSGWAISPTVVKTDICKDCWERLQLK